MGEVEQSPLLCPDDDAEAFFHALLINDDVSRRGPRRNVFEGGWVGWAEYTYWTSSEAGMSGAFSPESV